MTNKLFIDLYKNNQGKVSDKWSSYLHHYDRLFLTFKDQELKILEIGIENGGSLEIMGKYFSNAKVLVGCDKNINCSKLSFEDKRIKLVIGDVNETQIFEKITKIGSPFNIIIDDGSHKSSDVIKSFVKYFSNLADEGLYIIEDLHCSYWREYEGGLFYPYSSIQFFKYILDIINHEHWGINKTNTDILEDFSLKYGVKFSTTIVKKIESIQFFNSLCVIKKTKENNSELGPRLVVGRDASINDNRNLAFKKIIIPNQNENIFSKIQLKEKEKEIVNLTQVTQAKEQEIEQQFRTIAALIQSLTTKDEKIHNLSSSLSQRTEETEQQAKTIETLDREIKKVMSSNSYKYTAPLRELRRIATNPIDRLKYYIGRIGTAFVAILKRSHHHLPISYKLKRDIYKTLCIRLPGFFGPNAGKSPFIGPNHLSKFIIDERQNNQSLEKMLDAMLPIRVDEAPLVSVIIPVYGKINFTLNCLSSISENLPLAAFEVIVVDDCSPDNSADVLSKVNGIHIQRNENNQGFIRSCNIGAKAAKGQYLYFLNNDTIVTTGWLDELLRTFHEFPGTGLAGSKLVYPDGRLQEAGGIIFNDASCWNYGKGKDKDHINFNYARDVDYCSGASIMISKKLFFELGMFDNYFAPAYYEDTDLALKVRKKGLRVIYQPLSEVIHFEGATSGTDINSGAKQYQKINKEKFFTRYQDLLAHHNTSGEHVDKAIDRTRIKNCLVIDNITPLPDRDSGSIDTYNQLMFLHNYGFHVTFIPLENFSNIEHYTQQLQKKGIKCIYQPYYNSLKKFCSDHKNFFDLILINREENFIEIYSLAKKYFPKAKLWLHNVDLNFLRLARQAKIEKNFKLIKRAKEVKNSEIKNNINSDISTVVSIFELNYLTNKRINCELLPLFRIKNQKKIKTFDERNGLVFIAGFNHLPNQDALTYFLDDIFPSLQKHLPGVQCSIIGNNLPKNLLIRIKEFQNIQYYADKSNFELEELVNNHKIGIAPLRYGAGMKGKVITYMANHLPFVASNIALEGINLHTIKDCVYHSNTDFVEKIVNLYKDKALYENVQKEISFLYDQNFSEACYKTSFSNILHKLNLSQAESNF